MLSLISLNRLPLIRLPREGRGDLVFQGSLLAATKDAPETEQSGFHSAMALYKTTAGKFVLSSVSATHRIGGPPSPRALCFSCLADVRTYLLSEHPGQETMIDDSVLRAREKTDHCDWFGPGTYAAGLDCDGCPESENCTGRPFRPTGTT